MPTGAPIATVKVRIAGGSDRVLARSPFGREATDAETSDGAGPQHRPDGSCVGSVGRVAGGGLVAGERIAGAREGGVPVLDGGGVDARSDRSSDARGPRSGA